MSDFDERISNLSEKQRKLLALRMKKKEDANSQPPKIKRRENSLIPIPLSFAQQRMWILDQLSPGTTVYTLSGGIRLVGDLHLQAFEHVLTEIISRHAALRTIFVTVEGQPVQVVQSVSTFGLPVYDLSTLPQEVRPQELERLSQTETSRPFVLSTGPLFRPHLVRLATHEHLLLLSVHHSVFDGWSMGIFFQELTQLYEAFSHHLPSPLPPLPIQYSDYSLWQHDWAQGPEMQAQLSFWQQQLAGPLPQLELPTDHKRPALQTFEGAGIAWHLPAALSQQLAALSLQQGATLFMTLVAAFKVLLFRMTGQSDLLLGTPIANRTREELESLIGCFINTLVLRTEVTADLTFSQVVQRVQHTALAAYAHQELPFEQVVEAVSPVRDLSRSPLFQVMFVLQNMFALQNAPQNAPHSPSKLGELLIERVVPATTVAKFDLTVTVWEDAEGLQGQFEYNTALFEEASVRRLVGYWQTLLAAIVAQPEQRIADLPLLQAHEQKLLLQEWNNLSADYPKDKVLHELFEIQAEHLPDAIALVFEGQQLTYRALNKNANQLAHYLQRMEVGPDTLVGICVERSVEMVVGLLGILKAGGAYVPLDPAYPTEHLAFILNDTQTPVLLTQQKFISHLPEYKGDIICLDMDWEKIAQESEENVVSNITPDNLAYAIYTSGSTGKSKGALITHANVIRLFAATDTCFHFHQQDVWTFFHSYSFDFSVWELWGALLYGGRLVIISYLMSRLPEEFYQQLCMEGVTVLNQTPSAFYQLIWTGEALKAPQDLVLRLIIFGGEALEFQKLQHWFDHHGDQSPRLVNMYGITETTVHVTYHQLVVADLDLASHSVIGKPISDLQIYILDQQHQPVPIGVPGEIYVGGNGLARGYLNRPELTAERFMPDPFSWRQGSRLYKTGDRARYLADGNIEYLGRLDHQVKLRGFRIELGEIEATLERHPGVRESVVLLREDLPGDPRLVAYVVSALWDELEALTADLRELLQRSLPVYMLPSAIVVLEQLPLTPNGKLDRRALPVPEQVQGVQEHSYVAPRTPLEEQIAGIWAQVLGLERIGIHDNFFALGGHSLKATQVISRVQQSLRVNIPLGSLFKEPTISGLIQAIEQSNPTNLSPINTTKLESQDMQYLENLLTYIEDLPGVEIQSLLGKNNLSI